MLASLPALSPEERERRELGAKRLKERLSGVPYYAKCAEEDGDDYWRAFYASRVNS
jgi:predicted secreted protein